MSLIWSITEKENPMTYSRTETTVIMSAERMFRLNRCKLQRDVKSDLEDKRAWRVIKDGMFITVLWEDEFKKGGDRL